MQFLERKGLNKNPQNFFLNALKGLRHVMPPPPPPGVLPPGAITPEKVIRHNHKARGGSGGLVLSTPKTGAYQFVENTGFL